MSPTARPRWPLLLPLTIPAVKFLPLLARFVVLACRRFAGRAAATLLILPVAGFAQAANGAATKPVWEEVSEPTVLAMRSAGSQRTVVPRAYRTLRPDRAALASALGRAPLTLTAEAKRSPAELALPMPDGSFARVLVEESPLMEAALAARFPEIKTYVVRGIDDPTLSGRLDQTPQGFHAILLTGQGTVYIDPYWRDDATTYLAYYKRDFVAAAKPFNCLVTGNDLVSPAVRAAIDERPTGATLRTYRLALACTGEYATAAGGGTLNGALGAIITTVNRVSAVYERDLCIRLKLIDAEDQIIFLNAATDGYTNTSGGTMLGENQTKLDTVIGNANYDIGHVFSTGGGGIAGLGVVGRTGQKARGVTGLPNPVGDPFDIDFVAHEMGHQFGANHPFNATSGNCAGGNRSGSTAYEPGSGTTIMAYAGICSPQDLAPHSDDYFHTVSYAEIDAYTSGTSPGNVGAPTATGNTPPTIAAPASFTIPSQTPFALTAVATDPDTGDLLTYCWEEFDLGPAQDPTVMPRDNGTSPLFRSYDPTPNPTRLFPSLNYILANANVPPATIGVFATGEFLPTTSRAMTFRVTVRDNRAGGGGSNYASTTVTSVSSAGPFVMTTFNSASTIAAGSTQTIGWAVSATDVAPINCTNVKISLSTDGGQTFPYVLAASTPNDGVETVTIPNVASVATTQARFKVEAVGNIFFDLSDANTTITSTNTAPALAITGSVTVRRGTLTATTATVATVSSANGPLTAMILNAPGDTTLTASVVGSSVNVSALADNSIVTTLTSRTYPVTLVVTDALGATASGTFNLVVQPNLTPSLGDYANQSFARGSTVNVTPTAAPTDGNGNLGAAPLAVTPATLPGGGTLTVNQTTGVVTIVTTNTTTAGTYPVRVTVQDLGGAALVKGFNLTVVSNDPLMVAGTASAPTAENGVPANGAIDPAETVTVNFSLANNGGGATTNLVATLLNSGGVTPITTSQNYGAVAAQGSAQRAFQFTASGTCGGTITATLQLQDGATNLGAVTFVLRLGVLQAAPITLQNFDGVTAPALPTGWVATVAQGSAAPWATTSSNPDTTPNSVFATPTASTSDNILDSPSIAITGAAPQVTFYHRWNTESNWDGGVLEIAIGTGAFTDIVTAGGSFATGGYTQVLNAASSGSTNPLAGRSAWSGSASASYTTTTVNLPPAATGQSIRLRWRLGCDSDVTPTGSIWQIDTITLNDATYVCSAVPPVFTSALPPAGAQGVAYNHTFTASGSPAPTFALTAGTLPPGLALNGAVLAGTPTTGGTYAGITVTAHNAAPPDATQTFAITISASSQAPTIATQPVSQAILAGMNATFSVAATGSGTLSYQWYFTPANSSTPQAIAGATAASYTVANAQAANVGDYVCIVSNGVNPAATSTAAQLVIAPRVVRVVSQTAAAGGTVTVPIQLLAGGQENAMGFSLVFDPAQLTYQSAIVGAQAADATLNPNVAQASSGRVGIALAKPAGAVWAAGTQEIIKVTFTLNASLANGTLAAIAFGDTPVVREISDAQAAALPGTYQAGTVMAASGFEADMNGNGAVTITDWVKVGRIVAGLDPLPVGVDFMKADCAPRSTFGNGVLSITDWVQAGRYAAGLDPGTPVAGPTGP